MAESVTYSGTVVHHKEDGSEVGTCIAGGSPSWAAVKNKFRDLARAGTAVVGDQLQIFRHTKDENDNATHKYVGSCKVIRQHVISCAD